MKKANNQENKQTKNCGNKNCGSSKSTKDCK